MNCPVCNTDKVYDRGATSTMVGYWSPVGHNHDDNCVVTDYSCENRHRWSERKQNTCSACNWKGKEECFCHPLGVRIIEGFEVKKGTNA